MKYFTFAKHLLRALYIASMTLFVSCNDNDAILTDISESETREGYIITTFSIDNGYFALPDDSSQIEIILVSSTGETRCLEADYQCSNNAINFTMYIPNESPLTDDKYVMTLRIPQGPGLGGRLLAHFVDNNLTAIEMSLPDYMLEGSGTQEDPYIINSDESFQMFINNLNTDEETSGAGLFFKQIADVKTQNQNQTTAGRGYWGACFAGNYDGGGYTIDNLYYKGANDTEADSGIGIFRELRGQAMISNVKFSSISVRGVSHDIGVIAGSSNGEIKLHNIALESGSIGDEGITFGIGGLIGRVVSGNVEAQDIDFNIDIEGLDNIGGLFGTIEQNGNVKLTNITTSSARYSITGYNNIGGVIGLCNGSFSISNANLDHKVSAEDKTIRIITSKSCNGNGCVGGIVGLISQNSRQPIEIRDVSVTCPIGSDNASQIGGFIGKVDCNNDTITLSGCRFQSILSGDNFVGGIVGYWNSKVPFIIEGDNDDTRVSVNNSNAQICGNSYIGGFAGYWNGPIESSARIYINIPILGSNKNIGGAFGSIIQSSMPANFKIGDSSNATNQDATMRVIGNENVGGFAGYMENSELNGDLKFDFVQENGDYVIPNKNQITPLYSSIISGKINVGGLIGYAKNTQITRVACDAKISIKENNDAAVYGGIVGYLYAEDTTTLIEDCAFFGEMQDEELSYLYIGGIIGWFDWYVGGTIKNCINYSDILAKYLTGGIIGYGRNLSNNSSNHLNIEWCINTGNINGCMAGGICGQVYTKDDDSIKHCINIGKITNKNTQEGCIGGIIANAWNGVISCCANHGQILGSDATMSIGGIGGMIGGNNRQIVVDQCVNTASISSDHKGTNIGGIVGILLESSNCEISNSLNAGTITSDQDRDNGGIVGYMSKSTKCHHAVNRGNISYGNATIGDHGGSFDAKYLYYLESTGKDWPDEAKSISQQDFTNQASFSQLDFNYIWTMTDNGPEPKNCVWRNYENK